MQAQQPLQPQHVLITGGGTGIGLAIAHGFVAKGDRVTLIGRTLTVLNAALEQLREQHLGCTVQAYAADVCDEAQVMQAIAHASTTFGPVQVLVNNAGQASSAPFGKTSLAQWRQLLDVNLTGTFICTQAALPSMVAAKAGRIVNVASTAGLMGYSYVTAYCAAKHGVIGLTRALALELATKGVTVNAVCPGYTQTDIVADAVSNIVQKTGRSAEQAMAELAARNPQKRLVQPQEVADAVLWLCSAGASSITGQAIAVAGGEVM